MQANKFSNTYKKINFLIIYFCMFISLLFFNKVYSINKAQPVALAEQAKNELSVKFLDLLWVNRQNKETQEEIINLIKSTPKVQNDFQIAWRVSRIVYFIGNFIESSNLEKNDKLNFFKYGYQAGEIAKTLEPNKVEGHYWYAINLGSYGLEKGIFTALNNAKPGRDALLKAAEIDPKYHFAGPYRILGRYYQEVPGGFISFGDKKIAEEYFEKAIKTAPDFRVNTLYLGILKKKVGQNKAALELFLKAKDLPKVDGEAEEQRYDKELAENIKSMQNKLSQL